MRIRLHIARHELPVVKILWSVPAETKSVSKLLEQVNDVIPLESDGWGLEDYCVEIKGYECLHYLDVHSLLRDDDEVNIRALQSPDIKARTVSGRYQISSAGAHLLDGIVFGKNYLRRPSRPPVHIPPRKRPRLTYDVDESLVGELEAGHPRQLRIQAAFENTDAGSDEVESDHANHSGSFAVADLSCAGKLRSGKRRKSVSFDESSISAAQDDDEDEDGEDFDPSMIADDSEDSEDEVEAASTPSRTLMGVDDSDESSEGEDEDEIIPGSETSKNNSILNNQEDSSGSSSDSDSDDSSDGSSDSSDDSDSDLDSESEGDFTNGLLGGSIPSRSNWRPTNGQDIKNRRQDSKPIVAGGHGKRRTRERNERRKMQSRMYRLKRDGVIHPNMTLIQFRQWVLDSEHGKADETTNTQYDQRKGVGNDQEFSSLTAAFQPNEFHRQRQKLLDSIASGGVHIDVNLADPVGETAIPEIRASESGSAQEKAIHSAALELSCGSNNNNHDLSSLPDPDHTLMALEPQSSTSPPEEMDNRKQRSRLDVTSAKRLLWGGLGVRSPRNKAEEESLRAKLAEKTTTKPGNVRQQPSETAQISVKSSNPDAWRAKIKLTAVECLEEDVQLTEPPFPFRQRWDSTQQHKQNGKKRKREVQHQEEDFVEFEDAGVGLNYDDVIEDDQDQMIEDSQFDNDLPPLPTSMSELPVLTESDVRQGAIIAFKVLEVNQSTSWQPTISPFRTAVVERFEPAGHVVHLVLAKRDRSDQYFEYDDQGERILGMFEMPSDGDDEAAASGQLELAYASFVDPKLVVPAASDSKIGKTDEHATAEQTFIVQDSMVIDPEQDSMFTDEPASNAKTDTSSHISETSSTPTLQALLQKSAIAGSP